MPSLLNSMPSSSLNTVFSASTSNACRSFAFQNAVLAMLVTFAGMRMDFSFSHLENAYSPMLVILSGITISCTFLQSENALLLMFVTPSSITILRISSAFQLPNAELSHGTSVLLFHSGIAAVSPSPMVKRPAVSSDQLRPSTVPLTIVSNGTNVTSFPRLSAYSCVVEFT